MTHTILGIDPSIRHTGLCLLNRETGRSLVHEIRTTKDILSAIKETKQDLKSWVGQNAAHIAAFSMERQLPARARSAGQMFAAMMAMLEAISEIHPNPPLILPLPVQLQAYIRTQHGLQSPWGRTLVNHFKTTTGYKGRVSEHLVDAYYLAKLGEAVLAGKWRYNLPEKETALTPWKIINGDDQRKTAGAQAEVREALR